jgi:hypothetical protein
MATVSQTRRVTRRYAVSKSHHARLEFDYPGPGGKNFDFALIDISVSGLSFHCGDELPGLDSGTTLSPVVIRLGKCDIHGDLLVMHVTQGPPGETICGALFYPAKDADLLKLKSAIAGIEAVAMD